MIPVSLIIVFTILYFAEFKIKKSALRLAVVLVVVVITAWASVNVGLELQKTTDMNFYSREFSMIFNNLYELSCSEEYEKLHISIDKLHNELPKAIFNRDQFTDLINQLQSLQKDNNNGADTHP